MRQDCDVCGDYAECHKGVCAQCRLEGYEDETTEETQGEEDQEAKTSDSRGSSRQETQDEEGL